MTKGWEKSLKEAKKDLEKSSKGNKKDLSQRQKMQTRKMKGVNE